MVKDADNDGDGTINFEEFLMMMADQNADDEEIDDAIYRQMFDKFDKDGSGLISKDELRLAVKELNSKISDANVEEIIESANFDNNGQMNFESFIEIVSK